MDHISYFLDAPYILLDCNQQEKYIQLYYSIKTLRNFSDLPIKVYSNAKVSLDCSSCGIKNFNISKDFKNILFLSADDPITDYIIPVNSIFNRIPVKYDIEYSDKNIIEHHIDGCKITKSFVVYDPNETEYWIPSNYWTCSVRDRVNSKESNFCDYCCRLI